MLAQEKYNVGKWGEHIFSPFPTYFIAKQTVRTKIQTYYSSMRENESDLIFYINEYKLMALCHAGTLFFFSTVGF